MWKNKKYCLKLDPLMEDVMIDEDAKEGSGLIPLLSTYHICIQGRSATIFKNRDMQARSYEAFMHLYVFHYPKTFSLSYLERGT